MASHSNSDVAPPAAAPPRLLPRARREDRCQGYVGHDYIPAVRPTRGITNGGVRNVATVMPSTPRPLVAPSEVLSRGCGRSPAASTTTAPNARL